MTTVTDLTVRLQSYPRIFQHPNQLFVSEPAPTKADSATYKKTFLFVDVHIQLIHMVSPFLPPFSPASKFYFYKIILALFEWFYWVLKAKKLCFLLESGPPPGPDPVFFGEQRQKSVQTLESVSAPRQQNITKWKSASRVRTTKLLKTTATGTKKAKKQNAMPQTASRSVEATCTITMN